MLFGVVAANRRRKMKTTLLNRLPIALIWCLVLQSDTLCADSNPVTNNSLHPKEELRFKRRTLKSPNLLPEFPAPIGNVTAVLGRDIRLVCTIENLGQYQVAWLKEETMTILSIDTNIIITNYRIFLIPDEEERKWVLHIKDVQESDRGFYQCQVNTSPMRSTSGYLEVVVPPTIVESQTSQLAEVAEHSNVSIQCKANGHPRASISWRREDGNPISLNGRFLNSTTANRKHLDLDSSLQAITEVVPSSNGSLHSKQPVVSQLNDIRSDKLSLYDVDRSMAGIYVCTASNGIPSKVSKRVPLYVKFAPKTSIQNKYISVSLGEQLEIDCLIESFPKANSYWSKKSSSSRASHRGEVAKSEAGGRGAISLGTRQQRMLDSSRPINLSASSYADGARQQTQSILHMRAVHPHNRNIQLRHADRRHVDNADEEAQEEFGASANPNYYRQELENSSTSTSIPTPTSASAFSTESPKGAYVSIKQTVVNSFTYKLRMTIAKVQYEDFGEYSCIATNSMGSSESIVFVTRADKLAGDKKLEPSNADVRSIEEQDQSDANQMDQSQKPYTQQQAGFRRKGNRIVYDENYLQAIKTRTNNNIAASKLQQRLKVGQFSDRNSSNSSQLPGNPLMILITVVLSSFLLPLSQVFTQSRYH